MTKTLPFTIGLCIGAALGTMPSYAPGVVHAQVIVNQGGVLYSSGVPSGSCAANAPLTITVPSGVAYTCQNGTWGTAGGGAVAPPAFTTLTVAAGATTLATSGAQQSNALLTLGAGTTTLNVSGLVNGATFNVAVTQNGSGNGVLSLGTGCIWLAGSNSGFVASTTPTISGAIAGKNIFAGLYDGTNCYYNVR